MKWYGIGLAAAICLQGFAASAQNVAAPQASVGQGATVGQGLAQLKNRQPQQALAIFQQVLQANPNDVATNLYAAGAALELYQGELAVKYAEKARDLDPNNWKVHTTLVVAYAVAGRTTERNAERDLLRKLHADPKAPDAVQSNGFLVDMFPVKDYRVEAIEYFQPLSKFHVYYRFLIRNREGKRVWSMSVESNDFDEKSWEQAHAQAAADGERQFQLVGEGGATHVDYRMFSGKPLYDGVKAQVLQIFNAQTAPFPGETP
jgi:tetratricopeptide (TPR) repeat protein